MSEVVNIPLFEKNADNFRKEISRCLFKKYGLFPLDHITFLLEEELKFIEKNDRIEEVIILYDFIKWLKKEEIPYWLRGAAGSSLLFYILGITRGNPLPAHSLCPKCKSMNWLDHDYYSGYDVKGILKCEEDGESLLTDGHNIPWQSLWGYSGEEVNYEVDMPKKFYEKIKTYWQIYQEEVLEENILEIREDLEKIRFSNIDCISVIEGFNPNFYKNEIDIDEAVEYFDLEDIPKPSNFSDLLYALGLYHSTGVWTLNVKFMLQNLDMNLSDMVAFREDIYFYLLEHGYSKFDAWLGLDAFRRPDPYFEITEEMKLASDKWKLAIFKDILYLFPKAHFLEYLIFSIKNKEKY